jgi:hypothetical protein
MDPNLYQNKIWLVIVGIPFSILIVLAIYRLYKIVGRREQTEHLFKLDENEVMIGMGGDEWPRNQANI